MSFNVERRNIDKYTIEFYAVSLFYSRILLVRFNSEQKLILLNVERLFERLIKKVNRIY